MDNPKRVDEIDERRTKLLRIIDQGAKLEQLYGQEDFQFFMGWVGRLRDDLAKKILNGHLPVEKEEWHAKGGYNYLTKVLEAADDFKDKAKKARKQLDKFDKQVKEDKERYG